MSHEDLALLAPELHNYNVAKDRHGVKETNEPAAILILIFTGSEVPASS
jgi:hypothetical protein